jgi:hypothetical protein
MSNKLSIFKMKGEVIEVIDNGARDLITTISNTISNLKEVAFSGSYTDLTDTPTIPTVNNGTLTIQKNGEAVQTFSANQSGNATANITVPTTAGEISFNNIGTRLSATDVQNAIGEVNSNLSFTYAGNVTENGGTCDLSNYRFVQATMFINGVITQTALVSVEGNARTMMEYFGSNNTRNWCEISVSSKVATVNLHPTSGVTMSVYFHGQK